MRFSVKQTKRLLWMFLFILVFRLKSLQKKKKNFTENEPFRSSHISSVTVAKKIENISWPKVEKNFKWKGAGGLESILIFISHLLYWYKFLLPFSLFLVGKQFCGLIATNSGGYNSVHKMYFQFICNSWELQVKKS